MPPWQPGRAVLIGLPGARHLSVRGGAVLPDALLQDACLVMADGTLLMSMAPRPVGRISGRTARRSLPSSCAGVLGRGEAWCAYAGIPTMSPIGPDRVANRAVERRHATPAHPVAFHARAIGPASLWIASVSGAIAAARTDPLTWVALATASSMTTAMMATRLSRRALPVRDRVRDEMFDLAARFGREVPGGRRIDLPLSQDLLADLVGAARETVNRALRQLSPEVRLDGRTYVVDGSGSPAGGRSE